MTSIATDDRLRLLRPGRELDPMSLERLWRVRCGVVAVVHRPQPDDARPQMLALPGDFIGAEMLTGDAMPSRVFAVTAAELEVVPFTNDASRSGVLSVAYQQSRRQGREFLRLRTGTLTDRVRQLLLLLGDIEPDAADVELPSLRHMADILDASQEAICRVLGGMRQLELLVAREPRRALVARRALRELVPPRGMSSGLGAHRPSPSPATS